MVTEIKLGMIPLEPFNLPPRHQELQLAQLEEEEQEEEQVEQEEEQVEQEEEQVEQEEEEGV